MEYASTIALPDGWRQMDAGLFQRASPRIMLTIRSQLLPIGYTADGFFHLIQYDLRRDWWPTSSLFEIVAVEDGMRDEQPARRIRYRVRESPEFCVLNVEELLLVAHILPEHPHAFRVRLWMCEQDALMHRERIEDLLDSFQITTQPATYYKKFMSARGVTVKAAGEVDSAAVEAGTEIVVAMLSGREDIARCMVREGAELAIIPQGQLVTSLPEYAHLQGTRDFTGRSRDSFDIRGLGGVSGQPVSSAGEEQVLGLFGPQHPFHPFKGLVAVHEFAHGIQNLCFTSEDHDEWNGFYAEALAADLYPGTHMMADVHEFFAVFSTGYFEVTDELGQGSDRETLKTRFPTVHSALDGIYGTTILPEAFRTRLEQPLCLDREECGGEQNEDSY